MKSSRIFFFFNRKVCLNETKQLEAAPVDLLRFLFVFAERLEETVCSNRGISIQAKAEAAPEDRASDGKDQTYIIEPSQSLHLSPAESSALILSQFKRVKFPKTLKSIICFQLFIKS